ncbi:hypothetical protein [Proteiniphilum sp.]
MRIKNRPVRMGMDTAEEVTAATVKKAGVIFTPGKKLREMLDMAKFTKVQ